MKGKVVVTDYGFDNLDQEEEILGRLGYQLVAAQCTTAEEVAGMAKEADALLVQWAPVPEKVIRLLGRCKVIVRYGIGVDNVDLPAAGQWQIPVCNVPDYCVHEVADHTMAMAVALGRQLQQTSRRMREGIWKIIPPHTMPAFREMMFATAGYGRIAREVLRRAASFGFITAACDPFVTTEEMQKHQVIRLQEDELFSRADIISLHLPLNGSTHHFIDAARLQQMKPGALLVNTSRGALVDTLALAAALQESRIAGAGLDVFEKEPLPADHPLWQCSNAILTSHTAWYSGLSVPALQRMAAEEVARALTGQPLRNRIA